jgi:lysophospholipase L1-like esterase
VNISISNSIGRKQGKSIVPLGNIFTETSFASATDFPISGTGITRGTNKLDLTGNPTLFTSYCRFDRASSSHRYTGLEQWKELVRCKTSSALNGTSYGIGIGVRSINTWAGNIYSTYVRWSWDTTGAGKIYLYNVDATTNQIVSGTSYVATANTYYWVEVERAKNSVTTTLYADNAGVKGSQLYTLTQSFSLSSGFVQAHGTGQFVVQQFGGTGNEITHWETSSSALKWQDYCFIGDSNTYGLFATANNLRWSELAAEEAGVSYNISAAISERTVDTLSKIPEIIALKPRYVFISLGRNDIATGSGSDLATAQTNLTTIISTLEAAGIVVKLGGVIASNSPDVTALQTYYNGLSNTKVNFFNDSKSAGTGLKAAYNNGDGIHMNTTGHAGIGTLAATIL